MEEVTIESLDHEARGIAHIDGKVVFVDGALPGEKVVISPYKRKPTYDLARVVEWRKRSSARVEPHCPHFGVCGGCSMQHVDFLAQVALKQRVLEDALWHVGKVRPETVLSPLYGESRGYRHRARLTVRYVPKKGGVLVGFHERRSSYVADMTMCPNLPDRLSQLLVPLRHLVDKLSIRDRLPQIEVALGEGCDALVLRNLEPVSERDGEALKRFADRHGVVFYLQPKGPDTATRFYPLPGPDLQYLLPEFGVRMRFRPTDFTQVNHAINRVLVRRALALLDPQPGERIADLFCGLGNFTLPIAARGAEVVGIEGSPALVARAGENAEQNGLAERASFHDANLFDCTEDWLAGFGDFDKMLIDPPREGALEVVKSLPQDGVARIVYVSCNPATLARDASVLVLKKGYRMVAAGVANMFPHTSHVESIALFERV